MKKKIVTLKIRNRDEKYSQETDRETIEEKKKKNFVKSLKIKLLCYVVTRNINP